MQTKTNKTNKKEVDKIRKEPTERTTTTAGNEPTKHTVDIASCVSVTYLVT